MPKLPVASGRQVIKALARIGFQKVSQRGSHIKLVRQTPQGKQIAIIPNAKVVKKGTLRNGILKPLGISTEEFCKLLKKK